MLWKPNIDIVVVFWYNKQSLLKKINGGMMSSTVTSNDKNKELCNIPQLDKLKSSAKLTVFLVLVGIPLIFVPLDGKFDHFYFPKLIAMFILVLSFWIFLILNFRKAGNFVDRDWINKVLLIYLVFIVMSVFFTDNLKLAIYGSPGRFEGLITLILYTCLFLIARLCPKINDKLLIMVFGTALIVSIYGIFQFLGLDPFPRDIYRVNWGGRSFSTMGNPNFLGSYLVLMLPISIYFYILKEKNAGLIGYAIYLYCLLSTGTRGAWLGAIVSILSFFVLHFVYYRFKVEEFKRYIVLFVLSVAIVLIFNFQTDGALLNRLLTISSDAKEFLTKGIESDYAGANRGFIWKRVIELIKNRPIVGYGIENLGETFKIYYSQDMIEIWDKVMSVDKAHNEYLNIAVTTGVPSLIIYLSFVVLILKSGLNQLRKDNSLVLLLMSSVLGYLAAAFFNISVVSVAYVYWTFLGLIASSEYKQRS